MEKMTDFAKGLLRWFMEENSELDYLIRTNTDLYRKGFGRLWLFEDDRNLYQGKAEIKLRQVSHEYQFGANLFMLGQFPDEERNQAFEEQFRKIFNLGVIPFYWSDLEPEDGAPRFEKHSAPIYRRPPPDLCAEYCEKNHLSMKGHPLCWNLWLPRYQPENRDDWVMRWERRVREIAERYAGKVRSWDVINEIFSAALPPASLQAYDILRPEFYPYPENMVETAFSVAEKYFAPGHRLILNDDIWWMKNFHREYSPLYMLAQRLLQRGTRLGGLGFQYHMFNNNLQDAHYFLNPVHLYQVLDQYWKLGVPMCLSEISLISSRNLGDGDTFQKILTEKLYRLWFSHPGTWSLVWWNPVDGTAAGGKIGSEDGENYLRAGIFNSDLSFKPSAQILDQLINHEWHTDADVAYEHGGDNRFHGFYGDYDAEIKTDKGTFRKRLSLSARASKDIKIRLNDEPEDHFKSFWF